MTKPWPDMADSTTPPLATKVKARPSAASTSAPVTRPTRPPGYLSWANVSRALRSGIHSLGALQEWSCKHVLRALHHGISALAQCVAGHVVTLSMPSSLADGKADEIVSWVQPEHFQRRMRSNPAEGGIAVLQCRFWASYVRFLCLEGWKEASAHLSMSFLRSSCALSRLSAMPGCCSSAAVSGRYM